MEQLALVAVSGPDPKLVKSGLTPNSSTKDGQSVLTSTGLILTALPGYIITSLLPIYPFLQPQYRSHPSTVTPANNTNDTNATFCYNTQILLPGTRITFSFPGTSSKSTSGLQEVSLERIIELKEVRASLRSLLTAPSAVRWSLGWGGKGARVSNLNYELPLETQINLGSHIVILKQLNATVAAVEKLNGDGGNHQSLLFNNNNFSNLLLGTPVTAHGCPFGALVSLKFHNFMISGAISALLQQKQSSLLPAASVVALSDIKSLPGMEGGAVYIKETNNTSSLHHQNQGQLLGILGPPLRAPEADAELTVIISAEAVLTAVAQNLDKQTFSFSNTITNGFITSNPMRINDELNGEKARLLNEVSKAVVAVEAKNGWASGVLVSTHGHIITNAHALPVPNIFSTSSISSSSSVRVLVDNIWVDAEIIHICSAPIDLAVLKLSNFINSSNNSSTPLMRLPEPLKLMDTSQLGASPGRAIAVVGYPLWRPTTKSITALSNRPLVTTGSIALSVPALPAAPAVILTTADVHAGASGGAVVDLETGCLLGLVTSNTRLGSRSMSSQPPQPPATALSTSPRQPMLFPHLNYCLGSGALAPVISNISMTAPEMAVSPWSVVEKMLKESGVVEAWHSMRSMENNFYDLLLPNKWQMKESKLPSALAALVKSKGGGTTARPKL